MRITIAEPSSDLSPLAEEAADWECTLAAATILLRRLGRVIDRSGLARGTVKLAVEMLEDEFDI
jgi:hypothetical protein